MSSNYRSILNVQGSSFASTNSFTFDGNNDFVTMGNVLNFERLDTFSISAWVKKNDNGLGGAIIAKQETSGNLKGWLFYFNTDNTLRFFLRRQNQTYNRLIATSTNSISTGSWNHVLVTYDGSSTELGFNFYINGVDAGSNGAGSTLGGGSSLATTIPLQIGARNGANNFLGMIDEVSVFNTELSASDVSTIYGTGVPNDISSISGLVSWWRFEGTGTTATDSGTGGNDGTLENGVIRSTDVPT
jgi:hypothetical protein